MRILITGASGQLGSELKRCIETMSAEIGPIPAVYEDAEVVCTDTPQLDITDEEAVRELIVPGAFDMVINGAAITNVDGCERDQDIAHRVNALGPEILARATHDANTKFVHISTDYVFPGTEPGARVETDEPAPISVYGRTKLEGEERACAANPNTFIIRTAWLYGRTGANFVQTMVRLGQTHDEVVVVDDQHGNPTSANDLAHEILRIAATDNFGVYHCTNEGVCTWADFAAAIMKEAGLDCRVRRCTSAEYKAAHPESADRPAWSALENRHLADTIGNEMRPWREALASHFEHGMKGNESHE